MNYHHLFKRMKGLSMNNSCKLVPVIKQGFVLFVAKQLQKMKFLQQNAIWSISLAAIVFLLGSVYTVPVTARSVSERHLKVLRSDEQAIDLE